MNYPDIKVFKETRKSRVLKPAGFGCLENIPVINLTRGCGFYCVYCYANAYRSAPSKGIVYLYDNLLDLIRSEIDNPRRRKPKPLYVCFNTSSDCFQPNKEILKTACDLMRFFLERGIGVSFLTKGSIPDEFIDLFRDWKSKVYAQVNIVSMNKEYHKTFEPGAAPPEQRIENIKRLRDNGLQVGVRIDPILPGITDTEEEFNSLFRALFGVGVKEASLGYLMMRPGIYYQMKRSLSHDRFDRINNYFKKQKWSKVASSDKTKLLPKELRIEGYAKAFMIARRYRIDCLICACKNPDIETEICTLSRKSFFEKGGAREKQLGFDEALHLNKQGITF